MTNRLLPGQLWCYVTPILGWIIADQYLGKYNTLVAFAVTYIVGLIILFVTASVLSMTLREQSRGFVR